LFDLLTRLEGVEGVPYRLDPLGQWCLDRESIAAAGARAKALLLVSPNNPTGSMLSRSDREWVVEFAAGRGLVLIADEVFIDYPLGPRSQAASLLGESRALTMTLGGLSKSAGLPQMKLAWIVMSGPSDLVQAGAARLDVIADTYLSVATPVQCAAPALIEIGARRRRLIHDRVVRNLAQLRTSIAAHPAVTMCEPEGGWSVIVRVPDLEPEEQLVLRLLNEARVLVHPGYFFDLHAEAYLVLSLLPSPDVFGEGVARLLRLVAERQS
jgi:aspartate/methionine/tyrosine aminotransferase